MRNRYFWLNKIEVAKESTFHCAANLLRTRIFIKGVNNRLDISENTNIVNYDIVIKGSDNSLNFENDCAADGNHISLTMWKEEDEDNHV
jgi:hypothetical protein